MIYTISQFKRSLLLKCFIYVLCATFTITGVPLYAANTVLPYMPPPNQIINVSESFDLPYAVGLRFDQNNPLFLSFMLNKGSEKLTQSTARAQLDQIIKYFLAALAMPDEDLWVNLSPYEDDIVCADNLGATELGKDMLAEDYVLKQLTASLTYPESETGKKFWETVYQKVYEKTGTARIPVNTFNKVWIVPEDVVIYQRKNQATIGNAHLKVLSEDDYYALGKAQEANKDTTKKDKKNYSEADINKISSEVMRDIIIPVIEKEVNTGKQFAHLRQIYHSVILAQWFKKKLQDSVLKDAYFNQNKLEGATANDPKIKEKIFNTYMEAFKKGVYNYARNDKDPGNKMKAMRRQYISGGADVSMAFAGAAIVDMDNGARLGDAAQAATDRAQAAAQAAMEGAKAANDISRQSSAPQPMTDTSDLESMQRVLDSDYDRRSSMPPAASESYRAPIESGPVSINPGDMIDKIQIPKAPRAPAMTDSGNLRAPVPEMQREIPNTPIPLLTRTQKEDFANRNNIHTPFDLTRVKARSEPAVEREVGVVAAVYFNPTGLRDEADYADEDQTKVMGAAGLGETRGMINLTSGREAYRQAFKDIDGENNLPSFKESKGATMDRVKQAEQRYARFESTAQALRDHGVDRTTSERAAIRVASIAGSTKMTRDDKLKAIGTELGKFNLRDSVDRGYVLDRAENADPEQNATPKFSPIQSHSIATVRQLGTSNRGPALGPVDIRIAQTRLRDKFKEHGIEADNKTIEDAISSLDQGRVADAAQGLYESFSPSLSSMNDAEVNRRARDTMGAAAQAVAELKQPRTIDVGDRGRQMPTRLSPPVRESIARNLAVAMPRMEGVLQIHSARQIVDAFADRNTDRARELMNQSYLSAGVTRADERIARIEEDGKWTLQEIAMRQAVADKLVSERPMAVAKTGTDDGDFDEEVTRVISERNGTGVGSGVTAGSGRGAIGAGAQSREMREKLRARSGKTGGLDLNAGDMQVEGEGVEFAANDSLAWMKRYSFKGFNYEILDLNIR